jgi:hypothetical protein
VDKDQFGLQVLPTLNEAEVSGLGQIEIDCWHIFLAFPSILFQILPSLAF